MTLEEKTELLKKRCDPFRLKFPQDTITEFIDYWTEPKKSAIPPPEQPKLFSDEL